MCCLTKTKQQEKRSRAREVSDGPDCERRSDSRFSRTQTRCRDRQLGLTVASARACACNICRRCATDRQQRFVLELNTRPNDGIFQGGRGGKLEAGKGPTAQSTTRRGRRERRGRGVPSDPHVRHNRDADGRAWTHRCLDLQARRPTTQDAGSRKSLALHARPSRSTQSRSQRQTRPVAGMRRREVIRSRDEVSDEPMHIGGERGR